MNLSCRYVCLCRNMMVSGLQEIDKQRVSVQDVQIPLDVFEWVLFSLLCTSLEFENINHYFMLCILHMIWGRFYECTGDVTLLLLGTLYSIVQWVTTRQSYSQHCTLKACRHMAHATILNRNVNWGSVNWSLFKFGWLKPVVWTASSSNTFQCIYARTVRQ